MSALAHDPWQVRDKYIEVILKPRHVNVEEFFRQNCLEGLDAREKVEALKLLELQRHAMLMYTSCGWFFDEFPASKGVQILQYAGGCLQAGEKNFRGGF